ncbi:MULTISPECIES: hypothetical protein [Luteimonas]|uniref:hypothetical protein n=1 Tax=Luteimonas TaxID=83614 RepID=UPI0013045303|nr:MULTISPECIES: hypothetical protein [Luteimonas]
MPNLVEAYRGLPDAVLRKEIKRLAYEARIAQRRHVAALRALKQQRRAAARA